MNLSTEQKAILTLYMIPEISVQRYHALIGYFGSASAVLDAPFSELSGRECLTPAAAKKILSAAKGCDAGKEEQRALDAGACIITHVDPEYPQSLKNIPDHPPVLFVRGCTGLLHSVSIALVGTRRPTTYGRTVAAKLSRDLAQAGITTVSGLARGIDTEVHQATVSAGGKTIAVLGNGLNVHYPPENRKLEDRIADNDGAVISEFLPDAKPDKFNFPRRNRIISGLSLATVVVEAGIKSGALITARLAAEQGKDVFAVPGPVSSPVSAGPHLLVKSGAHLIESVDDIIEAIEPLAEWWRKQKASRTEIENENEPLDTQEENVLRLIEQQAEGVSIENLAVSLNTMPSKLAGALLELELKGLIRSLPGKMYVRNM